MQFRLTLKEKQILIFLIILGMILFPAFYFNSNLIAQKKIEAKVMTWNISAANGMDNNESTLETIIEEIEDADPDIIGLQEVTTDINIKDLADKLNMNYYFAEAGDTNEGNLLLTKYPIIHTEAIELPLIDGTRPRVLIKAEIEIKDQIFYIFITHLSRYDKPIDHWNQASFLASIISQTSLYNIILMGDLNFAPLSLAYGELKIKLRDTYQYLNNDKGYTFRSNDLFKRIDYIFCTFDLEPINSEVLCSDASDHCAVITTFK